MIIIGLVLSIFFILVIVLLCRTYTKDIFELENRILQLEKRIEQMNKNIKTGYEYHEARIENIFEVLKYEFGKDGEKEMACKKGRGGKKK